MPRGYRFIDHTADLGIQVWGRDAAQLFERAAAALVELLCGTAGPAPDRTETIEITGLDWPDLMVNWLREVLYLWTGRERIVCRVNIDELSATLLKARVGTARFDPAVHRLEHEIKAVTYHQIDVGPADRGWQARVIFDI